jgi:hypothetical protein
LNLLVSLGLTILGFYRRKNVLVVEFDSDNELTSIIISHYFGIGNSRKLVDLLLGEVLVARFDGFAVESFG